MSDGLVELDAHRDARVTRLTAEEARDLVEIRRSLDPLAAGLAAERRTREDLELIRATADELLPLRTDPGTAELLTHRRFHVAIYSASHNQMLVQTLDGLWDKADRYRRLALEDGRTEEDLDRTHAEHLALVDAIAAGDSEHRRRGHARPRRCQPRCARGRPPHVRRRTTRRPVTPGHPRSDEHERRAVDRLPAS